MKRLVVGISSASGFQYGVKTLQPLREHQIETHSVVPQGAEMTRALETDYTKEDVYALANVAHPVRNVGASIASGSFLMDGMLTAPCSMKTSASVAHGFVDNLLSRAADVTLKERRRLALMVREAPLDLAHVDNMRHVTKMGGVVSLPVPALYQKSESIDDMITHNVPHVLDLLGTAQTDAPRWQGQCSRRPEDEFNTLRKRIKIMQAIPANIVKFLSNHHVVSIAAVADGEVWAACCFYAFDEVNARLIVLISLKTKHSGLMSHSAKVAGTIAGQPDSTMRISGVQLAATVALIEDGADLKAVQSLFYRAHPTARVMKSNVWALDLGNVKFTDNKLVFAQKTYWNRED